MAETEAPASRRKPPGTATPSIYSHRARRRSEPSSVILNGEILDREKLLAETH